MSLMAARFLATYLENEAAREATEKSQIQGHRAKRIAFLLRRRQQRTFGDSSTTGKRGHLTGSIKQPEKARLKMRMGTVLNERDLVTAMNISKSQNERRERLEEARRTW
ncbi:hypothetical protein L596_001096 [Steinernema carpocapsae]|uniref:Uncharacterized protein n=1 Tax=Steinernema carpocapsae TaxID=34508 RepID=A0A4U8UP96_STECR|nr:hypothetical protein L596_001096 [Steinernema carpocapsae]